MTYFYCQYHTQFMHQEKYFRNTALCISMLYKLIVVYNCFISINNFWPRCCPELSKHFIYCSDIPSHYYTNASGKLVVQLSCSYVQANMYWPHLHPRLGYMPKLTLPINHTCTKSTEVRFICICLQSVSWRFLSNPRNKSKYTHVWFQNKFELHKSYVHV